MGLRERVRQAIERPVEESEKLLAELGEADAATRLPLLLSGWFRGLAAALEELAIAVDDLQARAGREVETTEPPAPREPPAPVETEEGDGPERSERADADEHGLLEEARRSREETAELREQGDEARRSLEDERT